MSLAVTQISEFADALDVRFVHVTAGPIYSIDERERCCLSRRPGLSSVSGIGMDAALRHATESIDWAPSDLGLTLGWFT
jgi:hypothetical protein